MEFSDQEIRNIFREKADDGRITCLYASQLAEEMGIPSHEIASILSEIGIKIVKCRLGCFK